MDTGKRIINISKIVHTVTYVVRLPTMRRKFYKRMSIRFTLLPLVRFSQHKIYKLEVYTLLCFDIYCTMADAYVYHFAFFQNIVFNYIVNNAFVTFHLYRECRNFLYLCWSSNSFQNKILFILWLQIRAEFTKCIIFELIKTSKLARMLRQPNSPPDLLLQFACILKHNMKIEIWKNIDRKGSPSVILHRVN